MQIITMEIIMDGDRNEEMPDKKQLLEKLDIIGFDPGKVLSFPG